MRLGLGVVVRAETDLRALIDRCRSATTLPVRWYIAAQATPAERAVFAGIAAQRACTMWLHASAPSIAAARNEAILASYADGCEATILLDEEVTFQPSGLDLLVASMLRQEAAGLLLCQPVQGITEPPGRSCLVFGSAAYNWVGAFDENITSGDLGLADYVLRAQRSGIPVSLQPNCLAHVGQADDSTTVIATERRYFEAKWGGPQGATTRLRPFDDAGCRIDWSMRATPYGAERDLARPTAPERPTALVSRPWVAAAPAETVELGPTQHAVLHAMIRGVYQALLQREPDPAALVLYTDRLSRGTTTLAMLCDVIRNSDECRKLSLRDEQASMDGTRAA